MKKLIIVLIIVLVILILLQAEDLFSRSDPSTELGPQQFYEQIEFYRNNDSDHLLIDIRTKPEYDQGHISGAARLDFYGPDFVDKIRQLDRDKHYLIYCRSGNRTSQTIKLMKQLGFKHVSHLKNGIISWVKAGYALE